eukprot:10813186-Heterocapsa_arctica.AAC.1
MYDVVRGSFRVRLHREQCHKADRRGERPDLPRLPSGLCASGQSGVTWTSPTTGRCRHVVLPARS